MYSKYRTSKHDGTYQYDELVYKLWDLTDEYIMDFREERVFTHIKNQLQSRDMVVSIWGAAHSIGLKERLNNFGFIQTKTDSVYFIGKAEAYKISILSAIYHDSMGTKK